MQLINLFSELRQIKIKFPTAYGNFEIFFRHFINAVITAHASSIAITIANSNNFTLSSDIT